MIFSKYVLWVIGIVAVFLIVGYAGEQLIGVAFIAEFVAYAKDVAGNIVAGLTGG